MRARALVWNADERRLRSPIRLVLAAVVVAVALFGFSLAVNAFTPLNDSLPVLLVLAVGGTAAPGVAVLVAVALLDRRTFADAGLGFDRDWWVDLGFGLSLGAGLMTAIFLLALLAGWVRVTGTFVSGPRTGGFVAGMAVLTLQFVAVGFAEELVARGYLLTNVAEGLAGYVSDGAAVAVAVVVSSLAFGVAHLTNPNATLVSTLGISLAGVFLAAGYVLTDELAIPVGLHITWNLFQGGVYGFSVSGLGIETSVVATRETGPDAITGGAFGPEAGALGVGAIVLGTALIVAYVRARYGSARVSPGLPRPDLRWRDGGEEAAEERRRTAATTDERR
ncbi:CPBP family intramembrane glutamic endopeptidase [Halopelagius fulvigenes]|uniref:CPBP family intramembrane glutamic endopeptidase n=1 Tax=Halopelagius fulvigenes TaxID=1198324 RepID=A0ABD5U3K2_9EURY